MERRYFSGLLTLHQKFLESIPRIQIPGFPAKPNLKKIDAEQIKSLRGLAFVFFSLLLGWTSMEMNIRRGERNFAQSHWPSFKIWNQALSEASLVHQPNPPDWNSLLKSHPNPFSESTHIWITEDGCNIYVPKSPFAERKSASELWTCTPKPDSQNQSSPHWKNLGSGIAGFELLLDFLSKNPLKPAPQKAVPRKWVDPKEIRY